MKKFISILLVILLVFSSVIPAMAADGTEQDEVYQGGFRCAFCDLYDKVKDNYDYQLFGWIITFVHTVIHPLHALIVFE